MIVDEALNKAPDATLDRRKALGSIRRLID